MRNSGLDWILVRPSVLDDKPWGRALRALTDLSRFHGGTVSREDVTRLFLDQGKNWLHRALLVTG